MDVVEKRLISWRTTMRTVRWFATGTRGYKSDRAPTDTEHTILAWWYDIWGYDYDPERMCGIERTE